MTASFDQTALIWGADAAGQLDMLTGHGDSVQTAAYSPDGRRIVTASLDGTARTWDAATARPIAEISGHDAHVRSAAYSPDGRRIVTASNDWTARTWDADTGAPLAVVSGHRPRALAVAVLSPARRSRPTGGASSPPPTTLPRAPGTRTRASRSPSCPAMARAPRLVSRHVRTATFSPDGRRIVTASFDWTARIWDADTARQVNMLTGHRDGVNSAAFSPDGRRIVTASNDLTARIWDADTGKPLTVLSGHDKAVLRAAFSPDGRHIVTAGEDRTVRIWNAASGVQLAVLSGHGEVVWSAAWSPDGRRIVTASQDGTARIWDANVAADLDTQIAWSQAAKIDELSELERSRLGLPQDARVRTWPDDASKCDSAAAAPYDPDRRASGVAQGKISADSAGDACTQEIAESGTAPRLAYQLGRALVAKRDLKGARQEFERAVSGGHRAAQVDLAGLLTDASAGPPDPDRAVSLYEKAWRGRRADCRIRAGPAIRARSSGRS